jgi:hypothetical protein
MRELRSSSVRISSRICRQSCARHVLNETDKIIHHIYIDFPSVVGRLAARPQHGPSSSVDGGMSMEGEEIPYRTRCDCDWSCAMKPWWCCHQRLGWTSLGKKAGWELHAMKTSRKKIIIFKTTSHATLWGERILDVWILLTMVHCNTQNCSFGLRQHRAQQTVFRFSSYFIAWRWKQNPVSETT